MGVDVRVVDWLRRAGHDAAHLREEGLQRAPDDAIFAKAIREDRIVLTLDLDFGDLQPSRAARRPGSSCSGSTTPGRRMSSIGSARCSKRPARRSSAAW
ncbi:MAG: DUF5615 family PIN-like protein [candidate division NC10 bacterium]